jgi:hypothetical protein
VKEISLETLSVERLRQFIGTDFRIRLPGAEPIDLELTAVTVDDKSESRYENFSLLFDGPGDRPLPQRIYPFEHERLGRFDLFIVPIANEGGRFQYQAVFNRLISES